MEKVAANIDEAESAQEVLEHPAVFDVVKDVHGDVEEREEAQAHPRLKPRPQQIASVV